jgi:GT2 family glycosyltransferase
VIPEHGDVTAVVTTHDSGPAILDRLRSLQSLATLDAIHVIDSGSVDGTPDLVSSACPTVEVTRLSENRGPCATRNLGLHRAKTPFVLWLDDDTTLAPGGLALLEEALRADDSRVMAGPSLRFADGTERIQYEGGLCHFAGLPHMLRHGNPPVGGPPREVDVLTSGCLLVRRDALLAAGGFDEGYFFLMEDVELSLRLRILGHRLVVVPEAIAHNLGDSTGLSLRGEGYPARRIHLHARNRSILVLSLWEPWTLFVLSAPLLLFEVAWFGFALIAGHPGAYLSGKLAVGRRLGNIRRTRKFVARHRRVRDASLLGSPPLTLTAAAVARPFVRALATVLDGTLRQLFVAARGMLR